MYCSQANGSLPSAGLLLKQSHTRCSRMYQSLSQPSYLRVSSASGSATFNLQHHKAFPRLTYNASKHKKFGPQYAYSGSGNWKSQNKAFSWDSLKNSMQAFIKGRSVEDSLRRQMQEQKNGGGGGRNPPRNGGNGGSGGPADKRSAENLDELLQVIMATIGFIFVVAKWLQVLPFILSVNSKSLAAWIRGNDRGTIVQYIFITSGDGLMRLSRDYIRYLFGAKASARLIRAMNKWKSFCDILTSKEARESLFKLAATAQA